MYKRIISGYLKVLPGLAIIISCNSNQTSKVTSESEDGWIHLIDEQLTAWNTLGSVDISVDEGILSIAAVEGGASSMIKHRCQPGSIKSDWYSS